MTVRLMIGAPALLLMLACPATPRDAGSSSMDEETIWRTWLVDESARPRRMMVQDTTLVKAFMDHEISSDQVLTFSSREAKRPERGEKATPEAMLELERRLQAVLRKPRSVPSTAIANSASALLPAEQYARLEKTCDTCGWVPFRRAHPGFEGAYAISRVAFFRSFALFYAEESTCGSASGALKLMKFVDGKWTVAGSAGSAIACGECPEDVPAVAVPDAGGAAW